MKKSIVSLAVAALLASPAVVLATETDTVKLQPATGSAWVDENNTKPAETAYDTGAAVVEAGYVKDIEKNEIGTNVKVGTKTYIVGDVKSGDYRVITEDEYLVRAEGTGKADAAKDPAAPAVEEAPKAEEKKEEAKPAAKAVKAAATKTGSKALPKTSAVK
ncbi:LPKTxAVK-anchored surface protein [Streptococcus ovuberis]|uniref:Uncharacterized protein n=1 Tax=Streptococcus ovuberis TaxID=1936207 RepID=A0A7X6S1G1_9STRE|nr:LPKTxAVK-anchored surface protein [Streptococcus ovuberis]NKZ20146.1 hypothetical protein [Streptococcus ovuberis]